MSWKGRWFWSGRSFLHLLNSRAGLVRHVVVELPLGGNILLRQFEELLCVLRIALGEHGVTGLVVDIVLEADAGGAGIELKGILALGDQVGVIAEERPVAGVDGGLLLIHAVGEIVAVGDTVAVGDDERGPIVGLGLHDGFDGMHIAGAHGDLGDIDAAVAHGHEGEILLAHRFAAGGKLGDGAARGSLGGLASGVGVDLGIEDEDVDVAAAGEDVIEAAIADVIGPAIAADDPAALLDQRIGHADEVVRFGGCIGGIEAGEFRLKRGYAFALGEDALLGFLVGMEDGL